MNGETDSLFARRPRVLLAEDDVNMRELVAEILRKDGFDVEAFPDGRRLCEAFLRRREGMTIDLIVSDVRMPFCSGLDVLEKVRLSRYPAPVLLMTAFGEPGLESRARELGGRLLVKPFTSHALRHAVRELLDHG